MNVLLWVVSVSALALSMAFWVRLFLIRRRAAAAVADAMRTIASIDAAQRSLAATWNSMHSEPEFFPKGRN